MDEDPQASVQSESDVVMADGAADGASSAGSAATKEDAPEVAPEEECGPPPLECVEQAEVAKERGNSLLKDGDATNAEVKYAAGIALVEPLLTKAPEEVGEDLQPRATSVYVALRLNSAQACLKISEWSRAIEHADAVIVLDAANTKALFRRGLAALRLNTESRLEQAKTDFTRVATLDPSNREARDNLVKAKENLRDLKKAEKQRLAQAMTGGLYKEQHAKLGQKQAAYQEEVARRKEVEEETISYEEWLKKEKEKEDELKKQKEEELKELRKTEQTRLVQEAFDRANAQRRESGRGEISFPEWEEEERAREEAARKARVGGVVQADDAGLDAEERRLLQETKAKGYYHGRLGTVLSDAAPKPVQVDASSLSPVKEGNRVGSEWNQAGTWEERDMSTWAKDNLTSWLGQASSSASQVAAPGGRRFSASAKVVKVKSLSGDAQLVWVRKQPKYGYNYEAELNFKVSFRRGLQEDGSDVADESFSGSIILPELVDTVQPAELRMDAKWKGPTTNSDMAPLAKEWLDRLMENIRSQVAAFRTEYHQKR